MNKFAERLKELSLEENDLVLIVADQRKITKPALGALRNKLGHDLELIDTTKFKKEQPFSMDFV